jgi:hypothetical protein
MWQICMKWRPEISISQSKIILQYLHRFNKLKHSTTNPKAFTEKGLYMLATILNWDKAVMTVISVRENFAVARRNMSLKNFGEIMFVFF